MVFYPPAWLPAIPEDLSAFGTVGDFVLGGESELPSSPSRDESPVLVSAQGDRSKTAGQLVRDVEDLAAALAQNLKWSPNESDDQGDRVIAILSENTLEYLTCCWAIHRIGATCLLLHGSTTPEENGAHIKRSRCRVLIASPSLLQSGQAAMAAAGVSDPVFYLNGTTSATNGHGTQPQLKTVEELMTAGSSRDRLPVMVERGGERVAYLCPTSGTSGLQKLARLTHKAIIANILQLSVIERLSRKDSEIVLGVLPLSHVQGVVASHSSVYLRDRIVMHTKFDMQAALGSIQTHKINRLYLVPSVLAALIANPFLFKAFDLSSIRSVYVGAGSVTPELRAKVKAAQPGWNIITGYGLTESPAAVAMSSPRRSHVEGTVGVLLPSYQARLIREDGTEVTDFDTPGELLVRSPNQASGYLLDHDDDDDDDKRNTSSSSSGGDTFLPDGWLRTGDVALFRRFIPLSHSSSSSKTSSLASNGDDTNGNGNGKEIEEEEEEEEAHLSIVDRLRDMIKVKGLQVSPVAIEECLRMHPAVGDVAVVGVADELAGERPKAFLVLAPSAGKKAAAAVVDHTCIDEKEKKGGGKEEEEEEEEEELLFDELDDFVEARLTELHWPRGRYEVLEALPRNMSGKVAKGVLRTREAGRGV